MIMPGGEVRRVAVVVRAHTTRPKPMDLIERVSGSALFDFYVLANETSGPLDFGPHAKIPHSIDTLRELGFEARQHYFLLHCGDLLFEHIRRSAPGYDYYVMMDHDVHLRRPDPAFFETLVRLLSSPLYWNVDLAAVAYGLRGRRWPWQAAATAVYPHCWGVFLPVLALSNRAIEFLFQERHRERLRRENPEAYDDGRPDNWIHCEAFVASALNAAGDYRCIGLREMLPGCYNWSTFNAEAARLLQPDLVEDPRVELYHPVEDAEGFLAKYLHWAKHRGRVPEAVERVRSGEWPLPEPLVERFLAEAAALV